MWQYCSSPSNLNDNRFKTETGTFNLHGVYNVTARYKTIPSPARLRYTLTLGYTDKVKSIFVKYPEIFSKKYPRYKLKKSALI